LPASTFATTPSAAAALAGCAGTAPQSAGTRRPGAALARIAIGSCTDQTQPQPIWATVLADRPDLVIYAGDNVYASARPFSIEQLRAAYERQSRVPEFARLREAVPSMAIWDDHDYGVNDGGAEFEHKEASKEAFLAFWRAPAGDARRARPGIYEARIFGPEGRRVQVIALDTRWFRSSLKPGKQREATGRGGYEPDPDPAKTMLGDAQWHWLEEQLREPAELRLVVSGIQVLAEGHSFERWGNLPLERERLYRLVARTRARGVVFLSGDRHIGAIYREAAGTPYPLYELTSSGITHPWAQAAEPGPNRIGDLVRELHYGMVEIDWERATLALRLKDLSGGVRHQHIIAFGELGART